MISILLWLLGTALVFVTLLPLWKTHAWWVRGCDFPRLHIFLGAGVVFALTLILQPAGVLLLGLCLFGVILFQGSQILPYTPLYPLEIPLEHGTSVPTFKILSSNVLKENEDHHSLGALITAEQPDILFLMETDPEWIDRLQPILDGFKTVRTDPRTDHYGMLLATKLEVDSIEFIDLTNGDTPTAFATLKSPNGRLFNFVGLHPRPPLPGDDTDARDEQIRKSATIAQHMKHPIIAMGDFNDVAWSRTSKMFRKTGGYRDPRVGRGIYPSFDVNHAIMRFPIDQVYLTEGVGLAAFGRGPDIGSDHFPMIVTAFIPD